MSSRFNVEAVTTEPTLVASQGMVELRFRLPATSGTAAVLPRLMGQLRCSLLPEEALDRCVLLRTLKNRTEASLTVFLPDAGEYALEVYANDPDRDGSSYFDVSCSIQI